MTFGIALAEQGFLPDWLIRLGIRRLLAERISYERSLGAERLSEDQRKFIATLRTSPLALSTREANEQHYEVPSAYFDLVLGTHRKYSSCLWPPGVTSLDQAEEAMLSLTIERAEIADGMEILELGCGWGSLSLVMASRFPRSRIVAVSNSHSQREFILQKANERGLSNLSVQTCDMNDFTIDQKFDRIVSVEMFEHLRNYELLFSRIASWLEPKGKLFTHVFYHGRCAYPFDVDGQNDWMAKNFFTGGQMPSAELFLHFQDDLVLEDRWLIDGRHYQKTLEAWLVRHDSNRDRIRSLFEGVYGAKLGRTMFHRWRIFYLACAELFGYQNGDEWGVAHYRFVKREV